MVFNLGASPRFYAIQNQPRKLRDRLQRSFLAIKVQLVLHNNPHLASRTDIVLWHDLTNNSINKHLSNDFQGLRALQLNRPLNNYRNRIIAII